MGIKKQTCPDIPVSVLESIGERIARTYEKAMVNLEKKESNDKKKNLTIKKRPDNVDYWYYSKKTHLKEIRKKWTTIKICTNVFQIRWA